MPTLSPIDDAPLLPLAGGAPSRTLPAMGSEPPGTDETPADLRAALDAAGLSATFDALAHSHRKEYVRWVDDAKKPETRAKRIAGTVDKLGG